MGALSLWFEIARSRPHRHDEPTGLPSARGSPSRLGAPQAIPCDSSGRFGKDSWRRSWGAIRLSCGHDLGSSGRHAGGPRNGTAFWAQSDFGRERPWGPALYGGKGQAQCGALRPILEALGAQRLPAHFPDCGWPSGSQIAGGSSLRRFHPRQPEALLSAALLAGTEPGRAGLEPRQAAWRRARPPGRRRTPEKACSESLAPLAAVARVDSPLLSHAGDAVCSNVGRSCPHTFGPISKISSDCSSSAQACTRGMLEEIYRIVTEKNFATLSNHFASIIVTNTYDYLGRWVALRAT